MIVSLKKRGLRICLRDTKSKRQKRNDQNFQLISRQKAFLPYRDIEVAAPPPQPTPGPEFSTLHSRSPPLHRLRLKSRQRAHPQNPPNIIPDLKSHTTRTRRVREKRIVHQPLHHIPQILVRHRLEHLAALDRYHTIYVWGAGELGAAEGFVFAGKAAVALLLDVSPDVFAAVVEGYDEVFAGDFLAEERGDEEGDGGAVDFERDGAGAVGGGFGLAVRRMRI